MLNSANAANVRMSGNIPWARRFSDLDRDAELPGDQRRRHEHLPMRDRGVDFGRQQHDGHLGERYDDHQPADRGDLPERADQPGRHDRDHLYVNRAFVGGGRSWHEARADHRGAADAGVPLRGGAAVPALSLRVDRLGASGDGPITSINYSGDMQLLYVIFNNTNAIAYSGVPISIMQTFSRSRNLYDTWQQAVVPAYHLLLLSETDNCPILNENGAYIWTN